jgi:ATP-dependent helicase/nuclease subunit A
LAAETIDRPVTLVAAAGSGKTTVLVRRYLELLKRGATPSGILTVTFTTDAAEQLRTRIRAALLEGGRSADNETVVAVENTSTIGTLHGFCYGVLNQYGSHVGLPRVDRILDVFERTEVFDEAYRTWLEGLAPDALRAFLRHWNHGDLRQLAQSAYGERHALRRALALATPDAAETTQLALLDSLDRQLLAPLDARLHASGVYTFDDLEYLALRILRDAPAARERLREQLQYFLVDEFQDTSRLQWEILDLLLGGAYQKLFIVGDPKQSIYSFRHADVRLFAEVQTLLGEARGDTLELTTNFRSRPEVLAPINRLSETLFAGSAMAFSPMRPPEELAEGPPGSVRFRRYACAPDAEAEARMQAEIGETVTAVAEKIAAGARPGEIALLFRVSDRVLEYARALEVQGIAAACRRTGRLFATYEATDVLNYLRWVHNPLDDFLLGAFLRSPYVGLTEAELWALHREPGDNLLERILRSGDRRLHWLVGLVESGVDGVASALDALFRHSTHWPTESAALLELLRPLTEDATSLAEAVSRFAAWEREDVPYQSETASAEDAVQLMTVHGSKGLEFQHVFLVDNLRRSPKQYPILRIRPGHPPGLRYREADEWVGTPTYDEIQGESEQAASEEAKRILYVALTRARQSLTVLLPIDHSRIPKATWGDTLAAHLPEA